MPVIAILGATGQIGRSLARAFARRAGMSLDLYARSPERIALPSNAAAGHAAHAFGTFPVRTPDIVLDCTGAGDTARIAARGGKFTADILAVDQLITDHMAERAPESLLVSFSSGVVHGDRQDGPVERERPLLARSDDLYTQMKLDLERRHRERDDLNLVDLRLFGYFSHCQNLTGRFLLSQAAAAIVGGKVLDTAADNIARDYVHPDDLCDLILRCADSRPLNTAFDIYSLAPLWKFDLLDRLADRFGLRYRIDASVPAGRARRQYYSLCRRAAATGYRPRYDAIDTVLSEMSALLDAHHSEGHRT